MSDNLLTKVRTDPWGPEDPAFEALVVFRRVVSGHLAEMFLDGKAEEVRVWARDIAQELKNAGVDIDDDIVSRLRDQTLGYRPPGTSECPF